MNTRPSPLRRLHAWCAGAALALAATLSPAQVGLRQLDLGGQPVTLVYPSAERGQPQRLGRYFELTVALNAAPTPGVHRLVVLSHGSGGSAWSDHDLAATLARAGFVVAQPLHAGDNYADLSRAGPDSWQTRPQEVRQLLDRLAAHPDWRGRLKFDRVGVHGMSAGGATALSLAGARWRPLNLVQHCLANAEADLGFCLNGVTDPAAQAERRARFERARGVPEMFLPAELKAWHGGRDDGADNADPRPDPRVAAVTLAVPVAAIFSADSLARIRVPVGLVTAGRDTMLAPAFHSEHVLRHCTACTRLADLPAAGHFDVLSPWPADIARQVAAQHPRGGTPEPGFDRAQRADSFERIARFHRRHLGD